MNEYRSGDRLIERWDDTTQTYYRYDENGAVVEQRPFNADEIARMQEDAAEKQRVTNQRSIEQALADTLAVLQAIIDTPNADMTTTAWKGYVKDLARAQRRAIRLLIRRLDSTT